MQWEYKTWELTMTSEESRYVDERREIDRVLNVFGKDGYELIGILPFAEGKSLAIFKRSAES